MKQMNVRKGMGKRLKMARKVNNLKLEEVATILRITKGSLSRYESGERNPDIEMITRLALVYKVRTEFLISGEFLDIGAGQTYMDFQTGEIKVISVEEEEISRELLKEKIRTDILELVELLDYFELKGLMNVELAHFKMLSHVLQNSEKLGKVMVSINDFSEEKLEKLAELIEDMQD